MMSVTTYPITTRRARVLLVALTAGLAITVYVLLKVRYTFVGEIPLRCPITINAIADKPPGFAIDALSAVQLGEAQRSPSAIANWHNPSTSMPKTTTS